MSQYKVATLPTFVSSAAFLPERRRSAAAAVREFFALSPAWLKIGVAFASLLFCILAVFSLSRIGAKQEIIVRETGPKTESGYSQQQVDEMIRQAREEERQLTARNAETPTKDKQEPKQLSGPKNSNSPVTNAPRVTSIRRPLSRAEREQLAADLRLLARPEDDGLELIGDRINQ